MQVLTNVVNFFLLKIEESALTGESVPVNKFIKAIGLEGQKDVPLGDRKNMMYMGCLLYTSSVKLRCRSGNRQRRFRRHLSYRRKRRPP